MKAVLSLLFLSILIFCAWYGYKKGLVMGIFSLIAFVVSVYGANLLSQTYSGEVIDALRPFASGFVEVNVVNKTVRPAMGIDSANLSVKDYFAQNPGRETEFCTLTYNGMGIYESTSEQMADEAVAYARENNAGWRIDYFVVSNEIASKVQKSEILNDVFGSDHCPILLEADLH